MSGFKKDPLQNHPKHGKQVIYQNHEILRPRVLEQRPAKKSPSLKGRAVNRHKDKSRDPIHSKSPRSPLVLSTSKNKTKERTSVDFGQLVQSVNSLRLEHQGDEELYTSYFEENWHVLRNDLKDILYRVGERACLPHNDKFAKSLHLLVKEEVPQMIKVLASKTFVTSAVSDEELCKEIQYLWISSKNGEDREKCNLEFHYQVFKVLLGSTEDKVVTSYFRDLKMLFFYEDRFVLASYEVFLRKLIREGQSGPALADFIENMQQAVKVIRDKRKEFMLPTPRRQPKTQITEDEEYVINQFKSYLTEKEVQNLKKTVYFNQSGLLHNLHFEYMSENITQKEFISKLKKFSVLYQDS